jgi:general secretion pathway protein G
MPLRRAARGFTLIELLIVIAIIGIIAAILIPNFLDALQKGKQKRTMAGVRDAGSAWFAWLSDHYGAAAAAGAPATYTLAAVDYGHKQAEADLVPQYIQDLIELDGWGYPLVYCRAEAADLESALGVMAILSLGRDGQPGPEVSPACGAEIAVGAFQTTAYDSDIVWADGRFLRFPQSSPGGGGG